MVKALTDAGARVVATARSVPGHSLEGVHYIAADIASATGCAAVAKEVPGASRASTAPGGGFAVLNDEEWFKELNVNLMPAVRLDR